MICSKKRLIFSNFFGGLEAGACCVSHHGRYTATKGDKGSTNILGYIDPPKRVTEESLKTTNV